MHTFDGVADTTAGAEMGFSFFSLSRPEQLVVTQGGIADAARTMDWLTLVPPRLS